MVGLNHLPETSLSQAYEIPALSVEIKNAKIGESKGTEHRITLCRGPSSFCSRPYRGKPRAKQVEHESLDKVHKSDAIVPSPSEWALPMLFARKLDGSLRFCVDYRRLHAVTVSEIYLNSDTDRCLNSSGAAKMFTSLDCSSKNLQITVALDHHPKTTSRCHNRTSFFRRMPIGLRTAPSILPCMLGVLIA